MTLLLARHSVQDLAKFKEGYHGAAAKALRERYGVKNDKVFNEASDPNNLFIIHYFDSPQQAKEFMADPGLAENMQKLGIAGEPLIQIFNEI